MYSHDFITFKTCHMADDLTNRGPKDRARIDIHEKWELTYWAKHFGVTEAKIIEAVGKAGVMVVDVKKYLGK